MTITRTHSINLEHTSHDDGSHTYRLVVEGEEVASFTSKEEYALGPALLILLRS